MEDNFWESVFSLLRIRLRWSVIVANVFTHCAILPAQIGFSNVKLKRKQNTKAPILRHHQERKASKMKKPSELLGSNKIWVMTRLDFTSP